MTDYIAQLISCPKKCQLQGGEEWSANQISAWKGAVCDMRPAIGGDAFLDASMSNAKGWQQFGTNRRWIDF